MKNFCYFWIIFCIFLLEYAAVTVPSCNTVEYSGDIDDPKTNETIFTYTFNVDVTKSDDPVFRNLIHVSNFSLTPLQNTTFKLRRFEYLTFWWNCDDVEIPTEDNTFKYPNQEIRFLILIGGENIHHNNHSDKDKHDPCTLDNADYSSSLTISMYVMEGEIFNSETGRFFDTKNDFCFTEGEIDIGDMLHKNSKRKVCCTKYDEIQIPESQDEICTSFESNISLTSKDIKDHSAQINITYSLTPEGFSYTVHTADYYLAISPYCKNNDGLPSCTTPFPGSDDFQYQLNIVGRLSKILIGQLIRRNGLFFMDKNISFTSENRCWMYSGYDYNAYSEVIFGSTNSTFCCTKFVKTPKTTTVFDKLTSAPDVQISTTAVIDQSTTATTHSNSAVNDEHSFYFNILILIVGLVLQYLQ